MTERDDLQYRTERLYACGMNWADAESRARRELERELSEGPSGAGAAAQVVEKEGP